MRSRRFDQRGRELVDRRGTGGLCAQANSNAIGRMSDEAIGRNVVAGKVSPVDDPGRQMRSVSSTASICLVKKMVGAGDDDGLGVAELLAEFFDLIDVAEFVLVPCRMSIGFSQERR